MSFKTIIIDDSSIQRLATTFLVKNHPHLEFKGDFENPYEGIKAVYEKKADILLFDVLFDDVNSFELLDAIEIPCSIVMNSTWARYEETANQYGIYDFIEKPISKKDFYTKMQKVINRLSLSPNMG